MDRVYWAFGSMLIVILIISLLPIGITNAGKAAIAAIGLLFAFGGLAAVASFSLWQTFLLLTILVLFTAYILDSRLNHLLYKKNTRLNKKGLSMGENLAIADEMNAGKQDQLESLSVLNKKHPTGMQGDIPNPMVENDLEMNEDIALLLNRKRLLKLDEEPETSETGNDNLPGMESMLEIELNSERGTGLSVLDGIPAVDFDETISDWIDELEGEIPVLITSGREAD